MIVSHEGCPFKFQDWITNAKVIGLTHVMVVFAFAAFYDALFIFTGIKMGTQKLYPKKESKLYVWDIFR